MDKSGKHNQSFNADTNVIKLKIFDFTKYCITSFRNVQFPKDKIHMNAKDLWKVNIINNDKVHNC